MLQTLCLCLSSVCVPITFWLRQLSETAEREPPVKISPSSGCQYKGRRSKTFPSHVSLCQISKSWSLCMKPSISTNLSGGTGTEFKAELWFVTASSRGRRPVPLAARRATDCICLFCSPRAPQMVMERITEQQPSESTRRLLSRAH